MGARARNQPGMLRADPRIRYEKKWKVGDPGAIYEFNIKLGRIDAPRLTDEALEREALGAIEYFEESRLRARYPWIGRVYRTGRSGGWLAVEDKTGGATKEDILEIADTVDESREHFERRMEETYGSRAGRTRKRNVGRQIVMPFTHGKIDADLRRRYDFFKTFGSGRVGHAAEDSLRLARAERLAEDEGWKADWEQEEGDWSDYLGEEQTLEDISEVLGCTLRDANGEAIGGLYGITFGHDSRENRAYGRYVEAELALEAATEQGLL